MNRGASILFPAVVVSTVVGCTATPQGLQDSHREAILDSVRAAMAMFTRYSEAAQWDSVAALYSSSPAFRFLESGVIQYASRQAVRDALGTIPPGTYIATTYRELEIDPVAPGVAVATGLFETTFSDSTGPRFRFQGALSLLWKHEPEGWQIRSGHSSAPVPRGN